MWRLDVGMELCHEALLTVTPVGQELTLSVTEEQGPGLRSCRYLVRGRLL